MMPVTFTPGARKQLAAIHDYIARENEAAARAVVVRVEAVAGILGANPHVGYKLPRGRLRRFPVHLYPYLIYYEVTRSDVRILRIRHAARYRAAFHEPVPAFAR